MTIIEFSEQLLEQIKQQAEQVRAGTPDALAGAARMISVSQERIAELQAFVYGYTFSSEQEEIVFFKEVKPMLLSQFYYYKKLFAIHMSDSYRNAQGRIQFYESMLARMEKYLKKNHGFYLYCMTGQIHLDDKYFTRKATTFSPLLDMRFSTGYDDRLAKLLANELLKTTLLDAIGKVNRYSTMPSSLQWTGNKTDAVELLFALHASGNINHGTVEVKQIAALLEELFNMKFGNYYDVLKKIRMRKGNRANFMDILKEKFLARIDQMEM